MLNHLAFGVFYGIREIQYTNPVPRFTHVLLGAKPNFGPSLLASCNSFVCALLVI